MFQSDGRRLFCFVTRCESQATLGTRSSISASSGANCTDGDGISLTLKAGVIRTEVQFTVRPRTRFFLFDAPCRQHSLRCISTTTACWNRSGVGVHTGIDCGLRMHEESAWGSEGTTKVRACSRNIRDLHNKARRETYSGNNINSRINPYYS